MSAKAWPICTAHYRDCGHVREHPTMDAGTEYAKAHLHEYVNPNGYALCACHPESEAVELGVTRFPCDAAPA